MKKTWMISIIIASLVTLAGAGFVVFLNVTPSDVGRRTALSGKNSVAQNSLTKRLPRKAKPLEKTINLKYQTPTRSSAELLEEFSSLDEVGRIRFIAALFSYEPSLLKLALSDKSKDVRVTAVNFISRLPEKQVDISPFLTMALDDKSAEVREAARNVIDFISDDNTLLRIMEISMNSKYADTRLKCVSELINLGVPRVDLKKLMLRALEDNDKNVRDTALQTASSLWDKEFKSGKEAIEFISSH